MSYYKTMKAKTLCNKIKINNYYNLDTLASHLNVFSIIIEFASPYVYNIIIFVRLSMKRHGPGFSQSHILEQ